MTDLELKRRLRSLGWYEAAWQVSTHRLGEGFVVEYVASGQRQHLFTGSCTEAVAIVLVELLNRAAPITGGADPLRGPLEAAQPLTDEDLDQVALRADEADLANAPVDERVRGLIADIPPDMIHVYETRRSQADVRPLLEEVRRLRDERERLKEELKMLSWDGFR